MKQLLVDIEVKLENILNSKSNLISHLFIYFFASDTIQPYIYKM